MERLALLLGLATLNSESPHAAADRVPFFVFFVVNYLLALVCKNKK